MLNREDKEILLLVDCSFLFVCGFLSLCVQQSKTSFQSSEDGIAQDKLLIGNSQELNYSVCATSILTCCMHFYVSFSFIFSFESWIACNT